MTLYLIFFNDTATTEIYTLSLHDALPICARVLEQEERAEHEADVADHVDDERLDAGLRRRLAPVPERDEQVRGRRSEEHTSELQSRQYLVCRLLLDNTQLQRTTLYGHHL